MQYFVIFKDKSDSFNTYYYQKLRFNRSNSLNIFDIKQIHNKNIEFFSTNLRNERRNYKRKNFRNLYYNSNELNQIQWIKKLN